MAYALGFLKHQAAKRINGMVLDVIGQLVNRGEISAVCCWFLTFTQQAPQRDKSDGLQRAVLPFRGKDTQHRGNRNQTAIVFGSVVR